MYILCVLNRHGTRGGVVAALTALALASVLAACGGAPSAQRTPTLPPCNITTAPAAQTVPPGAPAEDVCYATEWPSPNGNLYNTRVAHSTISSANVAKLKIAWTAQLPAYSNAPLAIVGNTLLAGVTTAHPEVVAYRLASG